MGVWCAGLVLCVRTQICAMQSQMEDMPAERSGGQRETHTSVTEGRERYVCAGGTAEFIRTVGCQGENTEEETFAERVQRCSRVTVCSNLSCSLAPGDDDDAYSFFASQQRCSTEFALVLYRNPHTGMYVM